MTETMFQQAEAPDVSGYLQAGLEVPASAFHAPSPWTPTSPWSLPLSPPPSSQRCHHRRTAADAIAAATTVAAAVAATAAAAATAVAAHRAAAS